MTASPIETETHHSFTLGHRLSEGPIALPEALRYANLLAEALRQLHDSGRKCGALQPSGIVLTGSGIELAEPHEAAAITPYTAPEILQGRTPDARSDIFAFGAIFYEMITGRRAFAGDNADALAVSLTISVPPPTGNAAVDHLITNCLAKDPAARCPRMQKVILELKLLTFAEVRSEAASRQQVANAALRAETQQLETRLAELQETHQKTISELQDTHQKTISELQETHQKTISELQAATNAALEQIRAQVATLQTELASANERAARAEQEHGEHYQSLVAHVEQVDGNLQAMDQRIASGEGKLDVLSQGVTVLQEYEATRMQEFEQALSSQSAEIALVSASQVQTDDLVEGVVAAMELLQSSVFDYGDK